MKKIIFIIGIVVVSCFLFVSCAEIKSMKLTGESALGMKIGDVIDDDSVVCEMQPYTTTDSNVRWVSSNEEVVTVEKSKEQEPYLGKAFCRMEAVGEGTAEIYAQSADGKIKSNSVTVTVSKSGKIETPEKQDEKEKGDETSFTIEDFTDENGIVKFDAGIDGVMEVRNNLMIYGDISYSDIIYAIEKYLDSRTYWGYSGFNVDANILTVDDYKVTLKGDYLATNQFGKNQGCHVEITVTFNENFSDFTVDKFLTDKPELFTSGEMQDIS